MPGIEPTTREFRSEDAGGPSGTGSLCADGVARILRECRDRIARTKLPHQGFALTWLGAATCMAIDLGRPYDGPINLEAVLLGETLQDVLDRVDADGWPGDGFLGRHVPEVPVVIDDGRTEDVAKPFKEIDAEDQGCLRRIIAYVGESIGFGSHDIASLAPVASRRAALDGVAVAIDGAAVTAFVLGRPGISIALKGREGALLEGADRIVVDDGLWADINASFLEVLFGLPAGRVA